MCHSRKMHVFLMAIATLSSAGCTWSPAKDSWPIPPTDILNHEPPVLSPNPREYKQISTAVANTATLRRLVISHSVERSKLDWANGDYTSLGAVAAVGGALAGQPGLMNTGAGLSVLGIAAGDRYKYGTQSSAYSEARIALDCVITQARTTNDAEVKWGTIQDGSVETMQAASKLPETIVQATSKVKEGLIARLSSIRNTPINVSDFQTAYKQHTQALADSTKANADLQSQALSDSTTLAQISNKQSLIAQDNTVRFTDAEIREKNRIEEEAALVPINRQTEVGHKLVLLPPKIDLCVAGF